MSARAVFGLLALGGGGASRTACARARLPGAIAFRLGALVLGAIPFPLGAIPFAAGAFALGAFPVGAAFGAVAVSNGGGEPVLGASTHCARRGTLALGEGAEPAAPPRSPPAASASAPPAHGYGTRPPWVSPGVFRVANARGDAYLEVRAQIGGHLGARGELAGPDAFRIVRLAGGTTCSSTPRWMREVDRRALAEGDEIAGRGVVARTPLALALTEEGDAFVAADRLGLAVQEADGRVRLQGEYADWLTPAELARVDDRHERGTIWPFDWTGAPPRAHEVWFARDRIVVALRERGDAWLVFSLDPSTGERIAGEGASLPPLAALGPAPGASIAVEIHAARDARGWRAAAEALADNGAARAEARLTAAMALALDGARERAAALARRIVASGEGHPSLDDLLAARVLEAAVGADWDRRWASDVTELALARGIPELFAAATRLGDAGFDALLDAYARVANGGLAPYADARAVELELQSRVLDRLVASRADADRESAAAPPIERLRAWLGASPDVARRRFVIALLELAEPAAGERDARADLVAALGSSHPFVYDVEGAATRELLAVLVAALADAERGSDAEARLLRALARLADRPPRGAGPARELGAKDWLAWWESASARPQAAEIARLASGPPSALWDVPDEPLSRALDELFAAGGEEAWPVLALGLEGAERRLDALGLRTALEDRLAAAAPSIAEARAAREAVSALLSR